MTGLGRRVSVFSNSLMILGTVFRAPASIALYRYTSSKWDKGGSAFRAFVEPEECRFEDDDEETFNLAQIKEGHARTGKREKQNGVDAMGYWRTARWLQQPLLFYPALLA